MPLTRPGPAPTAAASTGPAPARRVAALLAFVLGITSFVAGVTPIGTAAAQVAPAQIAVSKTTGIDPAGETLTITGTGFDPAAHVGTRPPLSGQPSGVYVTFGRFGTNWQPSGGPGNAANRQVIIQRWAVPAAQKAILDPAGTNPEVILLDADGTFTAELPVAPGGTATFPYAIAVYPGSGATNANQERLTPISSAPAWNPEIAVSKTTGIDPAGETLTITGTGFDPAAHVGTRPPLSGQPSGVYVTFGRFGTNWQPSGGPGNAANRQVIIQRWAVPAAQKAILDPAGTNPEVILLDADGTFTAELPVAPGGTATFPYAIAVYPGSGATNANQELLTPIAFGDTPPTWDPTVSVSETDGLAAEGEPITVTGSGFDPAANLGTHPPIVGQPAGVYVAFGRYADTWAPSDGAAPTTREGLSVVWALPAATRAIIDPSGTIPGFATLAEDGTFSVELDAAPGGTTDGGYAVVTYAGGGAVNAEHETRTAITFATTPPPPTPGTGTGPNGQTLTVTPYTDLDPDGQDLLVEGAGYDPAIGIYAALCVDQGPNLPPSPCVGGSGEASGSSSSAWITDDEQFAALRTAPFSPGGTFSVTINVTAADEFVDCYDPGTSCVLATRADHTATSNRTADVKVPVFFEGQTPVDPEPPAVPDTTATISTTSVVAGGDITVSGKGFIPGEQVQVWLHSDPQLMGVVVADAVGAVNHTFAIPAATPAGTHHIELYGVTSALRLISPNFTVVAAAVPAAASPAPTTTASGTLPVTGSNLLLVAAGLGLLALGLALVRSGRRPAPATTGATRSTSDTRSPSVPWEPRA